MPHKVWLAGEKVTAAQFNPYLQDQVVAQFPDAATRDAQWSAPPLGAACIITTAPTVLTVWNGSAWVPATFARLGATAVSNNQSMPTGAFTNVSNFTDGGHTVGVGVTGAGITFSPATALGLVAVTVIATVATAPGAGQAATATVFQNGSTAQAGVAFPPGVGGKTLSATSIFPADAVVGWAYGVQWWHNYGAAVACSTQLHVWKVGL